MDSRMAFFFKGDAFAERNAYAMRIDYEKEPPMFQVTDTHYAATWLLDERAPKKPENAADDTANDFSGFRIQSESENENRGHCSRTAAYLFRKGKAR